MLFKLKNIFNLAIKELIGLLRDPLMLFLILYSFTLQVYQQATAKQDNIFHAAIAVVDEDNSQLSKRITDAFFPPLFLPPKPISFNQIDPVLDGGEFTFAYIMQSGFQHDVLQAKSAPKIQLNVDATQMSQAFVGGGYIQRIITTEVTEFKSRSESASFEPVRFNMRNRFNPNLLNMWNDAIHTLVNNITMLAIILTGAAVIREREQGTLEHLLVMPVTPFEIMFSKITSMTLVVLLATSLSLVAVIRGALHVPIEGSLSLFVLGVFFHLFAVTALGIMLATIAQNMPQLGMLIILLLLPMQMLSGGASPRESMPIVVQRIMLFSPTTHFVEFSHAILFRGAGLEVVWKPFLCIILLGTSYCILAWKRFRKTVAA